ncbi:MAG TPA: FlgO family outer membrane protein [Elusimicrobiota bacterium]|nr:FlgO family outer membrane protein [Elusimicrobiota bacterium]
MRVSIHALIATTVLAASSTAPLHADPLKSVAKQLAAGMSAFKQGRVAVLIFPYDDGDLSSGSTLVSERLTTLLAQRKISIIERSRLSNLLEEMRLEETGATTVAGSQKPGGILGVDAVVTGTLADETNGKTEIHARLIRLETGEILAAASTRVDRTWDDDPRSPPAPVPEYTEDEPYQMHASALILTPRAGISGRRGAPAEDTMMLTNMGPEEPPEMHPPLAPPPPGMEPVPVIAQTIVYPVAVARPGPPPDRHGRPPAAPGVQAQMLYSLGVTLDGQGQHRQAERVYRQLLSRTPAPRPLVQRVQTRLAIKAAPDHPR